jgi:phosphoglycerol transferase MdoB-like AlkP superfamily enzyme
MVHAFEQMVGLSTGTLGAWGPLVLVFAVIVAIGIIVLKGFALWYAAQASQRWWFIAMLVLNTLGILEAVYLFFFHKKGENLVQTETKETQ